MELMFDLGDFEEENKKIEIVEQKIEKISEFSLIPKVGLVLGLDISETSSGVCMYENGEKTLANISLESKHETFQEVCLRRELKENLSVLVKDKCFDLIIIEDAFQGENPFVTRKLYAINTAIDELILDGVCECKDFRRVNNQQWKSWLFKADVDGLYKGLEDKLRIQKCLELLGVTDSGVGFQDRLDATGMILGYYLCKSEADEIKRKSKLKRVSIDDIECAYEEDTFPIVSKAGYGIRDIKKMYIHERRISKKIMLDYLSETPDMIFITDEPISIGLLGNDFNLPVRKSGGYFGFWVKPNKLNKYLKEDNT